MNEKDEKLMDILQYIVYLTEETAYGQLITADAKELRKKVGELRELMIESQHS